MTKHYLVIAAATGLGIAGSYGCGSAPPPQTYGEHLQDELSQERAEFIRDRQEDLQEVDTDIARLETRLQHEAQFVDAEQKADWSQDLFEARRERERLQAELERARTASMAEWNEMRGTIDGGVDRLQAAVDNVSEGVQNAFDGESQRARDYEEQAQRREMEEQQNP